MGDKKEAVAIATFMTVLGVTIGKGIVYLLTSSMSALTEFADSVTDIATSLLTFISVRLGNKPPDENHHYGHGKAEAIAGYTIGIFATIAMFYIAREMVTRLTTGYQVHANQEAIYLTAGLIVVDIFLVAINYIGYRIEKSLALRANTINYLGDTVRGSGLLLAISIPSLDLPIATLLFTFLAYEVYRLLRETTSVLMDESPTDLTLKIMEALRETKEVKEIRKIRTRWTGNTYHVDLTLALDPSYTLEEAHQISETIEKKIKNLSSSKIDVTTHLEPCDPS
jgi:ferrous-iron efflux pump FieF